MRRTTLTSLLLTVPPLVMLGGAYAAKPLYDAFCKVVGYGGTTQRAEAAATEVLDRTVTVRFDTNVAGGAGVDFAPLQPQQTVHIGENGMAYFRIANPGKEPVSVVATFNVTPAKVGPYFRKLQCFCFKQQTLEPGQSIEAPVIYYVDPAIAKDHFLDDITTITLSYTYFHSLEDAAQAAASKSPGAGPAGTG
jgi:cytochrome c oxidase assembly protein subunit 11